MLKMPTRKESQVAKQKQESLTLKHALKKSLTEKPKTAVEDDEQVSTWDRVTDALAWVRSGVLEREEATEVLFLALLCGEHAFFLGPPGAAKSMLIDLAMSCLVDARKFEVLMHAAMPPEELLGPLDLGALKEGKYRRKTRGYLPTAHVAFLDEVWKVSPVVFNSALSIMNERRYSVGGRWRDVPLVTAVGASNEVPKTEVAAAMLDRFLLRCVTDYVQEEDSRRVLLTMTHGGRPQPPACATFTMDDLRAAQGAVRAVDLPTATQDALLKLWASLNQAGVAPSDRRMRKASLVVKAAAWLAGRDRVEVEDLEVLKHVLWSRPEERVKVRNLVLDVAAPALRQALTSLDCVVEAHRKIVEQRVQGTDLQEAQKALGKHLRVLHKLVSGQDLAEEADLPAARFRQAVEAADGVNLKVVEACRKASTYWAAIVRARTGVI